MINVLYHGELLDEEGLPDINDKEADAIAAYIAYTIKYKEALKTHNQMIMQEAKDLKQQWLFNCDAARVPMYMSQNELNDILDVLDLEHNQLLICVSSESGIPFQINPGSIPL